MQLTVICRFMPDARPRPVMILIAVVTIQSTVVAWMAGEPVPLTILLCCSVCWRTCLLPPLLLGGRATTTTTTWFRFNFNQMQGHGRGFNGDVLVSCMTTGLWWIGYSLDGRLVRSSGAYCGFEQEFLVDGEIHNVYSAENPPREQKNDRRRRNNCNL